MSRPKATAKNLAIMCSGDVGSEMVPYQQSGIVPISLFGSGRPAGTSKNFIVPCSGDIGQEMVPYGPGNPFPVRFRGARVTLSADMTGVDLTASVILSWGVELFDTDNLWSAGAPTLFTIPAGLAGLYAELFVNVHVQQIDVAALSQITPRKSGTVMQNMPLQGTGSRGHNYASGPMLLAGGETFDVQATVLTDLSVNVIAARTDFSIRILP